MVNYESIYLQLVKIAAKDFFKKNQRFVRRQASLLSSRHSVNQSEVGLKFSSLRFFQSQIFSLRFPSASDFFVGR